MHLTYKKKIFLYFLLVFSIFTIIIIAVQQNREKTYKADSFKTGMEVYSQVIANYIQNHRLLTNGHIDSLRQVLPLLPQELRVTVINRNGNVLFDNDIDSVHEIGNHLDRPEIIKSLNNGNGSNIRQSVTTGVNYFYYAHFFSPYFVRVAMPYDSSVQNILKADDIFTYFILLLFFSALISLLYLADRFGKAVSGLNDFILSAENHAPDYDRIKFPETELGEIGNKIVANYKMLEESKNQLKMEKDKIIRHFHHSDEGICIFSAGNKKIYANTHFIQYLNTISDEPIFDVDSIFTLPEFKELKTFLENNTPVNPQGNSIPIWQGKISKNGKHFAVKLLIFNDNSYEVLLNNISSSEKNRLLKQEMTNNIAHELKTPVSSIRGYIETILEQSNIAPDKQKFFLERAYTQILRLSDLIDNTISYAGEKVTIHIEKYTEDNEYYYFSYYDTGRGIEEEHLTRIFDRFYRINPGRSRKNGGSGLGLSIVKNAILFHKGQISAKNRKDGGLEFIFSLRKELLQPSDTAKTSDTPPAQ